MQACKICLPLQAQRADILKMWILVASCHCPGLEYSITWNQKTPHPTTKRYSIIINVTQYPNSLLIYFIWFLMLNIVLLSNI